MSISYSSLVKCNVINLSDLLEIIREPIQHGESQELITLTKAMVQLTNEQSK